MKNKSIKIYKLGIYLCIISLYIMTYRFRAHYSLYVASFNILFYIGLMIFFIKSINKTYNRNKIFNKFLISFLIFLILSCIIFYSLNYADFFEKVRYIFSLCTPILYFPFFSMMKKENNIEFIKTWYSATQIICWVHILMWLFDLITGNTIQLLILKFYETPSLYSMFNAGRFISFFGHSLQIATLMFSYLFLTVILYDRKIVTKHIYLKIFVSLIGIAITGSKSILLLSLLLIFIFLVNKKNFKHLIPIVIVLLVVYNLGLLDNTLARLSVGLKSGDITTGRNTAIVTLLKSGILRFSLLSGNVADSHNVSLIAALEYPILRWAFSAGIIFALILSFIYFVLPAIKIFKLSKNKRIFFYCILYFLAVNIQDELATNADALILFVLNISLVCCLLKAVSNNVLNGVTNHE